MKDTCLKFNQNGIPIAPGAPGIGNLIPMIKDPFCFFQKMQKKLGPLFEISVFNQEYLIMIGHDANSFLTRNGSEFLSPAPIFRTIGTELGNPDYFTLGTLGERHKHLRKLLQPSCSKSAIPYHIPSLILHTTEFLSQHQEGSDFDVMSTLRTMVTDQIGLILNDAVIGELLPDLKFMLDTIMKVSFFKSRPRWVMNMPKYKNAKARLQKLFQQILENHQHPCRNRPRDMIDDLIGQTNEKGEPIPENAYSTFILSGFLAGMDTLTGTLSYLLYSVHHYEGVLEKIQNEIDALFDETDCPTLDELKQLEFTRAVIQESMRLHPVALSLFRQAIKPFEFSGYTIPANTQILVPIVATHFQEEFFKSPYTFNPNRFLKPNKEHRKHSSIYAPFGLGHHHCLGAGMAEIHCLIILSTILRYGRYEISPKNYKLKEEVSSLKSPKGLRLKLIKKRNCFRGFRPTTTEKACPRGITL